MDDSKGSEKVTVHQRDAGYNAVEHQLEELGYKQELNRSLGMVAVLGLSFAIMAVPFGTSTTLPIALTDGGPVTILYGWIFVSLISTCIAASLAEICSVYPTSGGVYYWSAMLSNDRYAPFASYITGWLGAVGNWTVTASINFGGAQLILTAAQLFHADYEPTAWQTVLVYWAALIGAFCINLFFNRHLEKLNTLCLWWTGVGVIIIIIVLLVKAPERHSAKWAFSHFDSSASGWPKPWAFFVGLLQAAYTLTGYGMVAALCEEVREPAREVPRAMVLSVVAAGATGVVYLLPIIFVLPDTEELLQYVMPMPILYQKVTGSAGGGLGLLIIILGIWFFAAVGSLTAASRCTWAFSRDGGIPFSHWWKTVNHGYDVPLNSLALSTVICALLGLIYLGSSAAFNAFTGVATICLGSSYAFPILCSVLRGRKMVKTAPYSLGKFGFAINILTIIWISFSIILFCFPTAIPVTPSTMNYASVVFAGFFTIAAIWYAVNARKHYTGPVVATLRRVESRRRSQAGSLSIQESRH